tara:strand:+ start:9408 stop:10040 length:633 start_codon:yes stop_codon:yes gene_type:complete
MKRVMMLLANGVEPLETAAFTDVLGWATLLGDEEIQLLDVGLRERITTTFGLTLLPSQQLANTDLDDFDALAIPGGFEPDGYYDEALSDDFLNVIRHFAAQGKPVASVCVASLSLGHAGILEGKAATIYHQPGGKRKQQLQQTGARFVDKPIVCDGGIITSTGPGTAIEVAFELLERLSSSDNADNVRQKMRIPKPSEEWYQSAQVLEES